MEPRTLSDYLFVVLLVLGHTNCGAVDTLLHGSRQHSRIQLLIDYILPVLAELNSESMLAQAVEANVRWSIRQILESPEGRERQAEGRMKLVGATNAAHREGWGK